MDEVGSLTKRPCLPTVPAEGYKMMTASCSESEFCREGWNGVWLSQARTRMRAISDRPDLSAGPNRGELTQDGPHSKTCPQVQKVVY